MTKQKKVLLVEDDLFTRFMMNEIITTLGASIDVAADGDECARLVNECPDDYGLVLMDLHMPKMSGIEAARRIRACDTNPPRNVPIVAVTADINYHDEAVIKKLGMDGFASKPVSPGKLLDLITRYCHAA